MDYIKTYGKIFYPDPKNDIISGAILNIDEKGPTVEFELPFLKGADHIEILLGEFNNFGLITCFNNLLIESNFGPGGNRCKYKITNLFTGVLFENKEELKFNSCRFKINSLSEWFNIRTIKHVSRPKRCIEFDDSKKVELKIPGFDKSLFHFGYSYHVTRKSTTLLELISFFLESNEPQDFWNFYFTAIQLKKLFALISEYQLVIEKIIFNNDKFKQPIGRKETDLKIDINLIDNKKPINPCPTSRFLNIQYIDIKDELPKLINKWLIIAKDNVAIDLLLEKAYNKDLSIRTYFLNLCMSLEIIHKQFICNHKFNNDEFLEIKKYLKSVVKHKKAKEWLHKKLSLGNQPSLKDRLNHFIDDLNTVYKEDTSLLINKIVNTRNYVVHSSAKKKYIIKDSLELYLISLTLETVIKGTLLGIMGIERENILLMYSKANEEIENIYKLNK